MQKGNQKVIRIPKRYVWGGGLAAVLLLSVILAGAGEYAGVGAQPGGAGQGDGGLGKPTGVVPVDLRTGGIKPHGDWFFAMQPGHLVDENHWAYKITDDSVPVYLTPVNLDAMVMGFPYSDYNYRWMVNVVPGQTFFMLRMSDGSEREYLANDVGRAQRTNMAPLEGKAGFLVMMLIGEPDDKGTVPAPWRTVVEAQFVGIRPTSTAGVSTQATATSGQ